MTTASTETVEGQYVVELDVVTDLPFNVKDLKDDLTRDLDVTAVTVTEHGPGGGWPIVRFSGAEEAILVLLYRYHEGNLQSVQDDFNALVERNY